MTIEIAAKYAIVGHDIEYTVYRGLGNFRIRGNVAGPDIKSRVIVK